MDHKTQNAKPSWADPKVQPFSPNSSMACDLHTPETSTEMHPENIQSGKVSSEGHRHVNGAYVPYNYLGSAASQFPSAYPPSCYPPSVRFGPGMPQAVRARAELARSQLARSNMMRASMSVWSHELPVQHNMEATSAPSPQANQTKSVEESNMKLDVGRTSEDDLKANLSKAFISGEYSDLTIRFFGNNIAQLDVHKVIVLPQSSLLRALVGSGNSVVLRHYEPDVMRGLMHYLYTREITEPLVGGDQPSATLRYFAELACAAGEYGVATLPKLAANKILDTICKEDCKQDMVLYLVERLYETEDGGSVLPLLFAHICESGLKRYLTDAEARNLLVATPRFFLDLLKYVADNKNAHTSDKHGEGTGDEKGLHTRAENGSQTVDEKGVKMSDKKDVNVNNKLNKVLCNANDIFNWGKVKDSVPGLGTEGRPIKSRGLDYNFSDPTKTKDAIEQSKDFTHQIKNFTHQINDFAHQNESSAQKLDPWGWMPANSVIPHTEYQAPHAPNHFWAVNDMEQIHDDDDDEDC